MIISNIDLDNEGINSKLEVEGSTSELLVELANILLMYLFKINPIDTTVKSLSENEFFERFEPLLLITISMMDNEEIRKSFIEDVQSVHMKSGIYEMIMNLNKDES